MKRKKKKNNKPELKKVKEKIIPEYILTYHENVKIRHPNLFKSNSIFVKKFISAVTKGEAKRILKRKLQEINS